MSNNLKVLLAGGAGFLGRAWCRELAARGDQITVVDCFLSSDRDTFLAEFSALGNVSLVEADICDLALDGSFDLVANLACPAAPMVFQKDPVHTIRTCVEGTYRLLEIASRCKAQFFLASTSEVYGDPLVHPQKETYLGNVNPLGPRGCYEEGKRTAESLCATYHQKRGLKVNIARIFNTYGPGMAADDSRVVPSFIDRALAGEALTIFGDGSQTRSFCYVDDMIAAFQAFIRHPAPFLGPMNLGNQEEITISELALKITGLCSSSSATVYQPGQSDDPSRRRPDLSLAAAELGRRPLVSLEEGLKRTIAARRVDSPRHK